MQGDENIVKIESELREICYKIKKKGRNLLTDVDITHPQFDALQYIRCSEKLTISELSSKMSLACSTITDLLDRMEKNNLVNRVKDENDKRIVRIKITDKGINIIDEVINSRIGFIDKVMISGDYSEEEVLLFSEMMTKFNSLLDKHEISSR